MNKWLQNIFYVVGILFGIVAIVSMVKNTMPVKILGVPVQSESAQNCPRGTWSPTLKICVEEAPQEEALQREAAPSPCEAGTHWSPTLKSCQPD